MAFDRSDNVEADVFDIPENVIVPEAQYCPAVLLQPSGANLIIRNCIIMGMLRAVYLDDQFAGRAGKIHDVSGDGHLAPEAETHQSMGTYGVPELELCIG